MIGYIYKLINKINNKVYIGQTRKSVRRRIVDHCKPYSSKNMNISRAIQKYGKDNFTWVILQEIEAEKESVLIDFLNRAEIFYIAAYNSTDKHKGYNISKGGDSKEISLSTRLKISESKKGNKNPNYGKKFSEEAKQKRRETLKITGSNKWSIERRIAKSKNMLGNLNPNYKKVYSDEEKEKRRKSLTGRKHTEEAKNLMSRNKLALMTVEKREKYRQAQLGSNNSMYGKSGENSPVAKAVIQYDKNGNPLSYYVSATEAGKITGISQKNISTCCTGKLKTAGGYVWKYKN